MIEYINECDLIGSLFLELMRRYGNISKISIWILYVCGNEISDFLSTKDKTVTVYNTEEDMENFLDNNADFFSFVRWCHGNYIKLNDGVTKGDLQERFGNNMTVDLAKALNSILKSNKKIIERISYEK